MGSFKRGLFLGGILGVGVAWLNLTKKGRETRSKLLEGADSVYGQIQKKVMDSDLKKNLTESKYLKMVQEYVDTYGEKVGLDAKTRGMLVKILSNQWKNLRKELAQFKK